MATIRPIKGKKGTTYQARWGTNPASGQPFTKNFKLRKEAQAFLSTVGSTPFVAARQSITLIEAVDQWLVACQVGRDGNEPLEPTTMRHYRGETAPLRRLALSSGEAVADITISKLTRAKVAEIRDALLQAVTRDQARRSIDRLKSALREALRRGQIGFDPTVGVMIRQSSRHREHIEIPQPDEVMALLATAHELALSDDTVTRERWARYQLMLETLVYTGMRPSELRGLPRKAISRDYAMITISQRADEFGQIGSPKSRAGRRAIRIQEAFWDALLAWLDGPAVADDPQALVFGTARGTAENLSNISGRLWYPLLGKAGVVDADGKPKYPLYSLRHFYASSEIAMGANHKELQEAMGHERIEMTLQRYGHLFKKLATGGQAARAAERARMLSGESSDKSITTSNVISMKSAS